MAASRVSLKAAWKASFPAGMTAALMDFLWVGMKAVKMGSFLVG